MAQLPADRSKLALAQGNQVPGTIAASTKNINAITEIYDTNDLLYGYVNQTLQGIYDANKFSRLGIINVLDFGAKGDGVSRPITAQELTSVNKLITINLFAYDPYNEGGFFLPHTTKNGAPLTFSDISIIDQSGAPFTNFTVSVLEASTKLTFNVQTMAVSITYTADKFNIGDDWDTIGIQLALDSLVGTNPNYPNVLGTYGGEVVIPKGRYNITKSIIVSSPYTQIRGSGKFATTLYATKNVSSIMIINAVEHTSLMDLSFDGNLNTTTNEIKATDLLYVTNVSAYFLCERVKFNCANRHGVSLSKLIIFSSFRDIHVSRCDTGIHLVHGICQVVFETVRVDKCRKDGWYINGDTYVCYALNFINCITEFNGNGLVQGTNIPDPVTIAVDGMEIRSAFAINIEGCYFENNGTGLDPGSIDINNPPSAIKLIGKDIDQLRVENVMITACIFSTNIINIFARHTDQVTVDNCWIAVNKVHSGHPTWSSYPSKSFDLDSLPSYTKTIRNCRIYTDIPGYSLASGVFTNNQNKGVSNYSNIFQNSTFRTTLQNVETGADAGDFQVRDMNANDLFKINQNNGFTTTTFKQTNHNVMLPSYVFMGSSNLKFGAATPSVGTWSKGDIVFNTGAAAGGKVGWVCVTAGTPGTWKPFGAIDA